MLKPDRIYNEDCLIGVQHIPDASIDCIICDLPYGVTHNKWDEVIPFDKLWEQYNRIIKDNGAILLFGQGMFTAELMISNKKLWRYNLIWDKMTTTGFLNAKRMPLRSHEDICLFYKKQPTYNPQMTEGKKHNMKHGNMKNNCYGSYSQSNVSSSSLYYPRSIIPVLKRNDHESRGLHPTQKPVALIEYLIKTYSNEGDLILDSCMGSGTTAVAAVRTGRHFIGFETNADYCAIAQERLDKELHS